MKFRQLARILFFASLFFLLALFATACGAGGLAPLEPTNEAVYAPKIESDKAGALNLDLIEFASGFNSPVSMANAGDDRLFVVEQDGIIKIVQSNGAVLPTPFLDIVARVDSSSDEEGLLGLTFHPDYSNNGYFYVNYTNTTGGTRRTRISRFSVTGDPNIADPSSEEILLTVVQPNSNHNAGDIHFGPDGFLYIPLGDGGGGGDTSNNAQNLTNLLGEVSRIDVDNGAGNAPDCVGLGSGNYTIPASNPFLDGPGGLCDEIWAAGVRNPWRSSFDSLTGDFYIADVGQSSWEEVDFQPANSAGGENYGWRCYEGNHPFNTSGCGPIEDYEFPVFEYDHSGGNCTIIGGYVYRGSLYPNMYGRYFFADYCSGDFWDLDPNGWNATLYNALLGFGTTTFGQASNGELYVAVRSGTIYHLIDGVEPTPTATSTNTATATSIATATSTATPGGLATSTSTPGFPPTATATSTVAPTSTATSDPAASATATIAPGATSTSTPPPGRPDLFLPIIHNGADV